MEYTLEGKMKITYENPSFKDVVVVKTQNNDLDIWEMAEAIKQLLVGIGFDLETVDKVIKIGVTRGDRIAELQQELDNFTKSV